MLDSSKRGARVHLGAVQKRSRCRGRMETKERREWRLTKFRRHVGGNAELAEPCRAHLSCSKVACGPAQRCDLPRCPRASASGSEKSGFRKFSQPREFPGRAAASCMHPTWAHIGGVNSICHGTKSRHLLCPKLPSGSSDEIIILAMELSVNQ